MMSPDTRYLDAWDTDYRTRGQLWGGNPAPLPELPDNSKVLELGCGNGKNLPGMIGKQWDVTAMDCSRYAFQLCRHGIQNAGKVHFVVGDAVYLPIRDSMMDAVISLHVIGHLMEPGRVRLVREASRVLKPGGLIIFRDFGVDDFRCGKGEEIEPFTFHRGTGSFTHYFTKNEVATLFHAFDDITIDEQCWAMKIKGHDYHRSEIAAVFRKQG